MKIPFLAATAVILGSTLALAELREAPLCGTFPGRGRLERAKHRFQSDRLARDPERLSLRAPRIEVDSDLVLMSDDGTIVSEANVFDLRERTLHFTPRGTGAFRYRMDFGTPEPGIGSRIGIGDDITRTFDLSFEFSFFGERYRRLYLNSDGNITFERGDNASTARSLERFLTGPPRIALFFADLDPSAGGEVRVANLPDRFVVTWDAVPEWGEKEPNTFQMELTPDGRVRMRFGSEVHAAGALVGLSPGGDPERVSLVNLGGDGREVQGAVAERFQRGRTVDTVAVARSFYRELSDAYDALVVWTNFESDLDDAFAFAAPVRNDVQGIGEELFDESDSWGSRGELESFVFMGNLRRYPRDPDDRVLGAASRPTTLGLLGHEVGHRWLARAMVSRSGVPRNVLLGRQSSHWSFFADSDGSFLEGNEIVQESEGRFRTGESVVRYSTLDLYLMGLAPASEVAPFFVVTEATASLFGEALDNESPPRPSVPITGKRTDVTIDEVVRALGPRRPGSGDAPTTFRQAWILVTRRGQPPSSEDLLQLQDAQDEFRTFFNRRTLGRGQVVTTIVR